MMDDEIIIKKESIEDDSITESSIFIGTSKELDPFANAFTYTGTDENEQQYSNSFSKHRNICYNDNDEFTTGMGSLCGEVFVTYNARKWTFVCSYCNKATRDIGEFICHITLKHISGGAESFNSDGEYNSHNGQNQECFDNGNILDVNVHVEKNCDESIVQTNGKCSNMKTIMANNDVETNVLANDNKIFREHYGTTECTEWNGQQRSTDSDYDNDNQHNDDDNELEESLQLNFEERAHIKDPIQNNANDSDEKTIATVSLLKSKSRGKTEKPHCNICNKTFPYYSLYRYHMVKHTNQTPFICPLCKRGFKSIQSLSYHKKTHNRKNQYYKCELCFIECTNKTMLLSHMAIHGSTEKASLYPCKICNTVFNNAEDRELHSQNEHNKEYPFECAVCKKHFREQNDLKNHLRLHRQYYCEFCTKQFSTTKLESRPYACPSCEKTVKLSTQKKLKLKPYKVGRDINSVNISVGAMDSKTLEQKVYPLKLHENLHYSGLKHSNPYNKERVLGINVKGKQRVSCKYCIRTYTHTSALNYHIRQKHPEFWK